MLLPPAEASSSLKSEMKGTLEMLPSERTWHESLSVQALDSPRGSPTERLTDPQGFSQLCGWKAHASDTRIHRKIGSEFQLKMIPFPWALHFGGERGLFSLTCSCITMDGRELPLREPPQDQFLALQACVWGGGGVGRCLCLPIANSWG